MKPRKALTRLALFLPLALLLSACKNPETVHRRSNLMDYVYPSATAAPKPNPGEAKLQLPARVGLAFVPANWRGLCDEPPVPPETEKPLLEIVRKAFQGKWWVKDLVIIPSTYLTPEGGFANLEEVARQHEVDVIALVSAQQVQYTEQKWWAALLNNAYSLQYLSVLGTVVLKGEKNDTQTLLEAAVFQPSTRVLLLRASGQSLIKGETSLAMHRRALRINARKGLEGAMQHLSVTLDTEILNFKKAVATGQTRKIDLIDREGRSLRHSGGGGGSWGGNFAWLEVATGLGLLGWARFRRRS